MDRGSDGKDDGNESFVKDPSRVGLGGRAVSGGFVTAGSQAAQIGFYFVSIVALSRLLAPRDFGLVAMVAALMGLLRLFREAGLSTATIQRETLSHAQLSNLFWINAALGATACGVGMALAPLVAWFYGEPRLVGVTRALSTGFLLSGAMVQHVALLNRQMRFKAIALIDVGSVAFGLATGIGMALAGFGYWALVGMQLGASAMELVLAWAVSGWRPRWFRRKSGTKALVRFGASLTVAAVLRRVAEGADTILIGRFYGADIVGFYTRAMALLLRPLERFLSPFYMVFVPLLARLQSEPWRYRDTFLRFYGGLALLTFPAAGVLGGVAEPLVLVVLGDRWAQVAPIFACLSIAALYYPLTCVSMWLLTTQGRGRDIMVCGIVFSLGAVVSFVVGLPFGAIGVALSFSLYGLLARLPIQFFIVGRSGPVTTRDLWSAVIRHLPSALVAYGATRAPDLLGGTFEPWARLGLGGAAGILAGALFVLAQSRNRSDLAAVYKLARFRGRSSSRSSGGEGKIGAAGFVSPS